MKKILCVLLTVALFCFGLTACGESGSGENGTLKIGVIQYMSHPSLDNCYNGIVEALEASDLDYELIPQTGSSTSADSDCANYAQNMVADGCDIIIAIATPAAKAAFAATEDTDIPVIFCAVSDPVAAGLVESLDAPGYLCSGTSDVLDLEAQVDLIQAMQPDVQTIGILYTSSEENSLTNLANFRTICDARNLTVEAVAVQGSADIPAAADTLASSVDCINNFTDNNVVNNLTVVLSAADTYGIPVYGSEEEQVKNGCLASVSIDYVALGRVTGEMVIEVLNGADLSAMPVKTISEATPIVNTAVMESLSMTLPEGYADVAVTE